MTKSNSKLERRYYTTRVRNSDYLLLKNLRKGRNDVKTQHDALVALADVVKEMAWQDSEKRRGLRIGVPPALEQVIKEVMNKTGLPFVTILVEAAKKYREKYPLSESSSLNPPFILPATIEEATRQLEAAGKSLGEELQRIEDMKKVSQETMQRQIDF